MKTQELKEQIESDLNKLGERRKVHLNRKEARLVLELIELLEFILGLNARTSSELQRDFPKTFNEILSNDSQDETVKKLLANDGILWRMVKEKTQQLLK